MKKIILPIHQKHIDKIISGEKIYEYRKILANKNIKKIYLYSSGLIKKVVGEVKVIEKIKMPKADLWEKTKDLSGIDYKFYNEYFKDRDYACAYVLGEAKLYEQARDLKEYGVYSVPQSFVYVEEHILDKIDRIINSKEFYHFVYNRAEGCCYAQGDEDNLNKMDKKAFYLFFGVLENNYNKYVDFMKNKGNLSFVDFYNYVSDLYESLFDDIYTTLCIEM